MLHEAQQRFNCLRIAHFEQNQHLNLDINAGFRCDTQQFHSESIVANLWHGIGL
jgi:hypothetical protein